MIVIVIVIVMVIVIAIVIVMVIEIVIICIMTTPAISSSGPGFLVYELSLTLSSPGSRLFHLADKPTPQTDRGDILENKLETTL